MDRAVGHGGKRVVDVCVAVAGRCPWTVARVSVTVAVTVTVTVGPIFQLV
jgi:predicted metal-dependent phosphotriesterase family hydrolase